ncbi:MAG: M48 family metallopeptidase, partial [Zoogloeaceae bacterium]|nr:M48 family metallopeptidase [Zoogloeaceae bacterium]
MTKTNILLGELNIDVTFKAVKNVHLSVHPPLGKVTLVAPAGTRLEVARAYAISRLRWIHQQQARLLGQARETPRQFVSRESHYIWGRRYLLNVVQQDASPSVKMEHRRITLSVRPETSPAQRASLFQRWQRALLHQTIPPLIARWESRIGVKVSAYFLQRMKT